MNLRNNNDNALREQLELHLHEQYAINNNANVSTFVAMVGSLLIAFTGYGYVLYQYLMGNKSACCRQALQARSMVDLATFAALIVILILYVVAVHIGASQRSDQFVIHKIRLKAYGSQNALNTIYPKSYSPAGKNILTFVQGIYNSLSWIFLGIFLAISWISWHQIYLNCCYLTTAIIGVLFMTFYRIYKFIGYRRKCKELEQNELSRKNNDYSALYLSPSMLLIICVTLLCMSSCCQMRNIACVMLSCSIFTALIIYLYHK